MKCGKYLLWTHTHMHLYIRTHIRTRTDAQWSGNEKDTNAKNTAQPETKTRGGAGGREWVFSLDPMSKAVNSQKALQRLATTGGVAIIVQPQAGKHVTVWREEVENSQRIRVWGRYWREGPSPTLRSVTLVRILGVYDFDVGEREEAPPSVHLALPLAADVHPRDFDDVANL